MNNLLKQHNEEMEKEFDEGFVWEECGDGHYALFRVCNESDDVPVGTRTIATIPYIKAFIRALLAKREVEIVEKIGKMKKRGSCDEIEATGACEHAHAFDDEYNLAISEIILALSKKD